MAEGTDELLAEQMAYYAARAPEYDEAYERTGRHDHGPEANADWLAALDEARASLDLLPLDGASVLELAAGTGYWTEALVARGARVTAVDASSEVLERNRERLGPRASGVRYECADVFSWSPPRAFDIVVFCFWISHVPIERVDSFVAGVAEALRVGGWVFFVDSQRERAPDDVATAAHGNDRVTIRSLNDGREFRVVKNFLDPAELQECFERAGLTITLGQNTHVAWGYGQRR